MNPSSPTGQGTTAGFAAGTSDTLRSTAQDTYSEMKTTARRMSGALRTELTDLKTDLDTLLGRASALSDDELAQEHARLMAKFSSLKSAARGVAAQANRQISRGVDVTTGYVKDKPLQSIAVASGVGLALGLLFGRR
ncbi:MAG: DUF883 domain-containing protein [Burkholderiales bacterium]|nr:DUF883 domain-containing protein [Burkholderiales bacterium]